MDTTFVQTAVLGFVYVLASGVKLVAGGRQAVKVYSVVSRRII